MNKKTCQLIYNEYDKFYEKWSILSPKKIEQQSTHLASMLLQSPIWLVKTQVPKFVNTKIAMFIPPMA